MATAITPAETPPDPDAPQPITILTRLRLEPQKVQEFSALMAQFVQVVGEHEPACLDYRVVQALGDPLCVLIIARYREMGGYWAHLEAPQTVSVMGMLRPLLDGPPEIELYMG